MKITDVKIVLFRTAADRFQHGEARPATPLVQTLASIETDDGAIGYYLGGGAHGDQEGLRADDRELLLGRIRSLLIGQDPFDRELIWKWLWVANIPENVASVVDMMLWDLAGRVLRQPVYKLLGGARDRVKAYASTYPNLGPPEVYAEHALACKREGYLAYKIHPHYFWNPATREATPGRPSNVDWDIATCRAVREAVGDEMVLMYDPWGTYHSLEEALKVGRELERLNFYWYEHPMPEYRVESYVRLARELSIPILSPEIAAGGVFTRAEWILRNASDMSRIDVNRGGITGARKTAIVCEAYGIRCEIHMAGFGNLQVLGATSEDTSEYYEKGLLAPGVDYDAPHPYLQEHVRQARPGRLHHAAEGAGTRVRARDGLHSRRHHPSGARAAARHWLASGRTATMRGVFPILLTPFDEHERIDEDSLRGEVEFVIGAGVHGVGLALGSEILKLTEAEREQLVRVVVDQVRGRVPIVVNTGAQSSFAAAEYSRRAVELGASAVMCLPPALASGTETRAYFRSISDAVNVPVFIQDTPGHARTRGRDSADRR